jgi:hypothetical protein
MTAKLVNSGYKSRAFDARRQRVKLLRKVAQLPTVIFVA